MTGSVTLDPARFAAVVAARARPPATLDALAELRARTAGRAVPLGGLAAVLDGEPGLAARFFGDVVPGALALAASVAGGAEAALAPFAPGVAGVRSYPRREVAAWLAHLFLGTPGERAAWGAWPSIDLGDLLGSPWPQEQAKLRCLLHYLARVSAAPPSGALRIERVVVEAEPAWADDPSPLGPLRLHAHGAIEDADGALQVDFANRYLGGGVLSGGCVQEEIRFAICPELIFGLIVSPVMGDAEAIRLAGAERYATLAGYAHTLRFAGEHRDATARGPDGSLAVEITAIDALHFRRCDLAEQLAPAVLARELRKALAGFAVTTAGDRRPVATGNWGCGVFNGHHQLKAVVQWLAASRAGRALDYFAFGEPRVAELADFADRARAAHRTVGALYRRLVALSAVPPGTLFAALG